MSFVLSESVVSDDDMASYLRMLAEAQWKVVEGRDYQTADVSERFPDYKRAFFLKLPPKSSLHPHVDAGDCRTDHIVMQTNDSCHNWWPGGYVHMEQGRRYEVSRTVLHWATNAGHTDRVHLLLEY